MPAVEFSWLYASFDFLSIWVNPKDLAEEVAAMGYRQQSEEILVFNSVYPLFVIAGK